MICNKENERQSKGITLIALIITIIILLILSGIAIGTLTGTGLFKRAEEAKFKTKMSAIAEEWDLYKMNMKMNGENPDVVYAGEVLKKIIRDEGLEIGEDKVINIIELLKQVEKEEEKYVIIHEGELYYVSQSVVKHNKEKVKWCNEIGIKIWDYVPPSKMGVVNGSYENVNGVYMCTPQLTTGFSKDHTRYVYLRDGNLVPGNWINRKPDEDWYDYDGVKDDNGKTLKESTWANLYIESNGIESYYVWIPRYVYKKASNERMDVKFVDINNNYKDAQTEEEIKWADLQKQGYKLPEAFWWDNNSNGTQEAGERLSGYWISKYQLK